MADVVFASGPSTTAISDSAVIYTFGLASYSEIDDGSIIVFYTDSDGVDITVGSPTNTGNNNYSKSLEVPGGSLGVKYNGVVVGAPQDPTGTAVDDKTTGTLQLSFTLNETMPDNTKVRMTMFIPMANMESDLPNPLEYNLEDHSYSYTFLYATSTSDIDFRVYYDDGPQIESIVLQYIATTTTTTTAAPTGVITIGYPVGASDAAKSLIDSANGILTAYIANSTSLPDITSNSILSFLLAVRGSNGALGYDAGLTSGYFFASSIEQAAAFISALGSAFHGSVSPGGITVITPSNGGVTLYTDTTTYIAMPNNTPVGITDTTYTLMTTTSGGGRGGGGGGGGSAYQLKITKSTGATTTYSPGSTFDLTMPDGTVNTYMFNGGGSAMITRITRGVACFLADAPVLTPAGYRPIASLRTGDLVVTAAGAPVPIQAVTARVTAASAAVNPYVIPKGRFGALRDLAISPDHKVAVGDKMVSAASLGLAQANMSGRFTYYNLELPNHENMVVAGVTVESQYPIRRVTVTMAEFREMLVAKYGRITPAILARVQKKVRLLADGRVIVPVDKRTA